MLMIGALHSATAVAATANARLGRGEILFSLADVKGSAMPKFTVRAVFDAPAAKVWPLIDRCGAYAKTMLNIAESKEVSRKGNIVVCSILVDMPWPISDLRHVTRATHMVKPGVRYRRAWSLVRGDYSVHAGAWTLTPFGKTGKRTLVVYTGHVQPNVSVPIWLVKKASARRMPALMKHLRKQVARAAEPRRTAKPKVGKKTPK